MKINHIYFNTSGSINNRPNKRWPVSWGLYLLSCPNNEANKGSFKERTIVQVIRKFSAKEKVKVIVHQGKFQIYISSEATDLLTTFSSSLGLTKIYMSVFWQLSPLLLLVSKCLQWNIFLHKKRTLSQTYSYWVHIS